MTKHTTKFQKKVYNEYESINTDSDGNPCLGCCALTSKFSTALHFTFTYHLVKVKHLCPFLDVCDTSSGMICCINTFPLSCVF